MLFRKMRSMSENDSTFETFERQFNDPDLVILGNLLGADPETMTDEDFDVWAHMQDELSYAVIV